MCPITNKAQKANYKLTTSKSFERKRIGGKKKKHQTWPGNID